MNEVILEIGEAYTFKFLRELDITTSIIVKILGFNEHYLKGIIISASDKYTFKINRIITIDSDKFSVVGGQWIFIKEIIPLNSDIKDIKKLLKIMEA